MRFSIRFTVDELALGPVLAALNSHDGVVFDHLAIEPLTPRARLPSGTRLSRVRLTSPRSPRLSPPARSSSSCWPKPAHKIPLGSRRFSSLVVSLPMESALC